MCFACPVLSTTHYTITVVTPIYVHTRRDRHQALGFCVLALAALRPDNACSGGRSLGAGSFGGALRRHFAAAQPTPYL